MSEAPHKFNIADYQPVKGHGRGFGTYYRLSPDRGDPVYISFGGCEDTHRMILNLSREDEDKVRAAVIEIQRELGWDSITTEYSVAKGGLFGASKKIYIGTDRKSFAEACNVVHTALCNAGFSVIEVDKHPSAVAAIEEQTSRRETPYDVEAQPARLWSARSESLPDTLHGRTSF